MKRVLILLLIICMTLTGCSSGKGKSTVQENAEEFVETDITSMSDPAMPGYVEYTVYNSLIDELSSQGYVIDNVQAKYVSKEYIEELEYNSQENIFFGYTLSEIEQHFEGKKYIFTLGDNGKTTVTEFESYDDTYERVIKNVAIGSGVILVCVTVSVATGGAAPAVSLIFATSAKTAAAYAVSGAVIGGATSGIATAYQTGDTGKALKSAALAGSEGFKWGAITGAVSGGTSEFLGLRGATANGLTMDEAATIQKESKYPLDVIKQFKSMDEYKIYKDAGLTVDNIKGQSVLISEKMSPNWKDSMGRTNVERIKEGLAPVDKAGNPFELHHVNQDSNGTLAILTQEQHRGAGNFSKLHDLMKQSEVHGTPELDAAWATKKELFWKAFGEKYWGV